MIAAAQLEKGATPDLELVRQVLEGSTSSFELIMRRYNRRLYRIARGVLRNDDDAEEVVQDPTSGLTGICTSTMGRDLCRRGSPG